MIVKKFLGFIRDNSYFPRYSGWIFLLAFVLISLYYNYNEILTKPPQSIHQWRQSDCLSITKNYFQDDNSFLEPAVHNLGTDGTGKTMSEFPLIYYTVGKLWQVTGPSEFLYRLLILLIFFSGVFSIFKLMEDKLKDSIIALSASLLIFTSPTLVYYANNFLMDIPALSFAFVALYFFYRYYSTEGFGYLILMSFFYLLAGLFKISSLLSFVAIGSLFILELLNVKLSDRKLFPKYKLAVFILFTSVLIIQFIWYSYAKRYNLEHNSGFFLIGTLPIWDLNREQIATVFEFINVHIKWDYFRRETQIIIILMFLSLFVFYRKVPRILLYLNLILAVGFLMFIVLFFQALKNHDYYTINLFVLVPVVLFSFLIMMRNKYTSFFSSIVFKLIILFFLIYNIVFAQVRIENLYKQGNWENNRYLQYLKPFEEIDPYLDSLGIEKDDHVLSLSDNSINITLYMMNLKGWTNYGINSDSVRIKNKIESGAKYLFIHMEESKEEPGIKPYLDNKIGQFKNIEIFAL